MCALKLGTFDIGKKPANPKSFLEPYHTFGETTLWRNKGKFRDDDRNKFVDWQPGEGSEVKDLQELLFRAGFMTRKFNEGVFDYVTQAAVRLFQEYIRTIDPGDKNFARDGEVGKLTMGHLDDWTEKGKVSQWGPSSSLTPSEEYTKWIELLGKAQSHYELNPGPIMKLVSDRSSNGSTLKVKDWKFDSKNIHLIGIRRKQDESTKYRKNDDLFVLLVNGRVFKFWGSTDPSQNMISRTNEAFLVEGQHKYQFGWHGLSKKKIKKTIDGKKTEVEKHVTYRALRPFDTAGVLAMRDGENDNRLNEDDIRNENLELVPDINIHWSGLGKNKATWSAGCQVIMGQSYLNPNHDKPVNCSSFSSASYDQGKAKGAYSVLADLVVCYSKPTVNHLFYTLGREESLMIPDSNFEKDYVINALQKMKADITVE